MRASLRVALAVRCSASLLVPLALSVPDAAAQILNVATTAELQSAIANAQAGDTVVLAPGVYQPSARIVVGVDLTIQGDLSAPSIIDGNGEDILLVLANDVRIQNLTLRNGRTAVAFGGGEDGHLTISQTTIAANTELGVATGDGGGHVSIVNSTIAGNLTGIASACSSFTLRHATVSGNDRGLFIGSCSDDSVAIHNTLVAGNQQDCRVRNGFAFAGNTSFDGDGTCRVGIEGGTSVFTTVANAAPGPLAGNGGPTMTMAPAAGSPAVDAGTSCTEVFDQRGARRDAACDVGAFERSAGVSMASASGAGAVDLATNAGTFLTFHPVAEADMPNQAGKPGGVSFPYGFFAWSVGPLTLAGGTAEITMTFPSAVTTPAQYWKVVNGAWTDICLLIPCAVNGNQLTITYQDGGVADLDGMANAVIVDPGGLGVGGESVDATPPQIAVTSPMDGATYRLGEIVHADYACSDEGSGVNLCAGPVSSGAAIDTSSIGPKTFTVQAADNAGNPAAASVTYQVGCDYVSLGLSPSTVVAGTTVRIAAGLQSCSTTAQTIVLRFTLTGAGRPHGCSAVKTTTLTTPPIALPAGFNRSVSFSYRVPAGTCPGEYLVSVATLVGGAAVDTERATLTVVR